jgi:hypothetical protein
VARCAGIRAFDLAKSTRLAQLGIGQIIEGVNMDRYRIKLHPFEAADYLRQYVENSGVTSECVADYRNQGSESYAAVFMVFEKYMMRNSSRTSLSVMIENLGGETIVVASGSGGGEMALLKFDWGAGKKLQNLVVEALREFIY